MKGGHSLRAFGAGSVSRQSIEEAVAKLYMRAFPKVRFRIYAMLGRLIGANISGGDALEHIYDVQSDGGRNKGDFAAVALRAWIKAYREHGQLSEAVAGWVPQSEVLLLEAGERSGRFQQALAVMLRLNERMSSIYGMIAGKLTYPVMVALILSGVIYYMATDLMPTVIGLKGGAGQFTGSAGTVAQLMNWVRAWLIPSLLGLVATIAAIIFTMPYFRGPVRVYFDKFPPWGVHRFVSGTSFLTALLVMIESGRGLVDSLSLLQPNASPYMAEKIARIEAAMREGGEFGAALASTSDQFPDKELVKEIQIFGRIGRLDEGLLNVVEEWMVTATDRTRAQIGLVSTLIMFGTFAVLGLVFTGLYDIVNQLKQG